MSLVNDAKRLAERDPSTYSPHDCAYCEGFIEGDDPPEVNHRPDCPWIALLRIVAALEAGERMAEALAAFDAGTGPHEVIDGGVYAAMRDFVTALHGEVVPSDSRLTGTTP